MKKKITLMLLAALLASTFACGQSNDTPKDTKPSGETTPEVTTAPEETPDLPADLRYDGYTFRILARKSPTVEQVFIADETGDVLSDSVYKRNGAVEDRLGIKFEVTESSNSDWETDAINTILAGDDTYDAIAAHARASFTYAMNETVVNWFDIDNINLSKSWWNQDAINNLAVNGKLYSMDGDITYATLGASVGMVFNKGLFDDYQLEYPYDLVDEGKWTFDTFDKYARTFSQDLNGDGKMQIADDLFGYGSNHWLGPIEALYSTGERIITVNKDGTPELSLYKEDVIDVFDKYMNLLLSNSGWNQLGGDDHQKAFCDGRMGLVDLEISHLSGGIFRDANIEFGLVPWPKYDESVDKYYSFVGAGHTMWIVPVTNPDLPRTGAILEMMAYYGQKYIIPAYYDVTLQNKYLRDDRSVDMLDYIRAGSVFDLGYYNNSQFGGALANPGYNLVHDTTLSFTTLYAQNEQSVKALIEKSMETYAD